MGGIITRSLPAECYGQRSFDDSPIIVPEGIVSHYISDKWGHYGDDPYDIEAILTILSEHRLSYHTIIARDGTRYRLVPTAPECYRAWHAGESQWRGRSDCNDWTIGVALVGMYGEPFTDAQYDVHITEIAEHVQAHPIVRDNLPGHQDIAPDRKSDPGPSFNWRRVEHGIAGLWPPDHE